MQNNEIEHEWKKDAPRLAAMERENLFSVPSNYFEELSEKLVSKSIIEALRIEQEKEFKLSTDYFTTLESRIKAKIENLKEQEIIPNSSHISKENYQDKFKDKTVELIDNKKTNFFKTWISYGAAASVSILLGTIVYLSTRADDINKQLTKVSDKEIIEYLQIHSTTSDNQFIIENLDEEDLHQVSSEISIDEIELYINSYVYD